MTEIKSGRGRVASFEYVAPDSRVEKFTRGPWRCSKKTDFVVVDKNEDEIADASCGDSPQANTSLIAAAPDLYEALSDLVDILELDTRSYVFDAVCSASAALAKARGES